jgi:hypothetical protein
VKKSAPAAYFALHSYACGYFFVWFIPFFVFGQIDKTPPKNQLSFSGKVRIFYSENKETAQLIFSFLVTLTYQRKNEKWNEPDNIENLNQTKIN